MFQPPPPRSRAVRIADTVFLFLGLAVLIILVTVYQMPFRLDDVLHMDWARQHSLLDAFHVQHGEIVRSVRPVFAIVIWLLTHTAGTESYIIWHITLVGSFFIGLAYAGLTARYISQSASALYFTVILFWIAFLPILNVLFWFGDLTFSIELMFTAAAWYYGLRGLCEARLGFWMLGCFLGICAVLAKEPAIVMVNAVLLTPIVFYPKDVRSAWQQRTATQKIFAFEAYLVLIAVCITLFFASPTKGNRFFDLSSDQLDYYVLDRLRYYGVILSSASSLLFVIPVVGVFLMKFKEPFLAIIVSTMIGVTLSRLNSLGPYVELPFFLVTPILLYYANKEKNDRALLLNGFAISQLAIFGALLITIMLVKAQLTEFAFCAVVVSGCAYAMFIGDQFGKLRLPSKKVHPLTILVTILIIVLAVWGGTKYLSPKEQLLRDVQATRFNANDAIKWMAKHLPEESTVLVTAPSLYGPYTEGDMTGLDDEFKSFAQYTFLQGFVRVYFWQLHRPDLRLAYLEDSTMLHKVLDAFRSDEKAYLFLQTGRDHQRFHSVINGRQPLTSSDTLVASFRRGPYPSEIWQIGH